MALLQTLWDDVRHNFHVRISPTIPIIKSIMEGKPGSSLWHELEAAQDDGHKKPRGA